MKRPALVLAAIGALAAAPGEHADTHPPTGVTLRVEGGARHYEAVVPGPLLDWAAPRTASGARQLFLLAAPEGAPGERRVLYHLDLESRRLGALGADLDGDFDRLAALDLDGDGVEELILGAPGRLVHAEPRLAGGGGELELHRLLGTPGVDLGAAVAVRGGTAEPGHLTLPAVGLLHRFARGNGAWGPTASVPLPTAASRHGRGIRLVSPPTTLLRLADGDLYAIGPEAIGDRRLRTLLQPADGAAPARQAWGRLPGAERLQWSWFDVLDGRPILVVTTNSADKLGVFERQRLRLFSLRDDLTRSGVRPQLVAETTSRRWQRVEPFVADVDGDGDEDLVVVQVDGLGGNKVVVEAFVNNRQHGFAAKTRRSALDRAADGWHFGSDLTGDGRPDLVLVGGGEIAVHETLAGSGRHLVARQPRWTLAGADIPRDGGAVEVGGGGVVVTDPRHDRAAAPRLLDLDGDGRDDILLADPPRWGFGRLRVVLLPPDGS